jgi:hypothetical protein
MMPPGGVAPGAAISLLSCFSADLLSRLSVASSACSCTSLWGSAPPAALLPDTDNTDERPADALLPKRTSLLELALAMRLPVPRMLMLPLQGVARRLAAGALLPADGAVAVEAVVAV